MISAAAGGYVPARRHVDDHDLVHDTLQVYDERRRTGRRARRVSRGSGATAGPPAHRGAERPAWRTGSSAAPICIGRDYKADYCANYVSAPSIARQYDNRSQREFPAPKAHWPLGAAARSWTLVGGHPLLKSELRF